MNEGVDTSAVDENNQPDPQVEEAGSSEQESGALQDLLNLVNGELASLDAKVESMRLAQRFLQRVSKQDALTDFAKLERDVAQCKERFGAMGLEEFGLRTVVEALDRHLVEGKKRMRQELGRQLKDACTRAGLKLKVVTREDPVELRIPPLAVRMDLDSGRAEILFAKQVLDSCAATADDILKCRHATLQRLDSSFDPAVYFEHCWVAYKSGLAAVGGKRGDRLELVDFLAHLAVRFQGPSFFVDPVAGNFRGYSRGQFAYDVNRLRLARGLQRDGKRLNFGVATGTTATKKARVIYMEDEFGQGEYKLNVYLTEGV